MPSELKTLMVEELRERFGTVQNMIVVAYHGIPAEDATSIRRDLRGKQLRLRVVKNSMARRAVEELGKGEFGGLLDGPVAVISGEDPVAASKAALGITRGRKLEIKGGWVEGRAVSEQEVRALAALPSKEMVMARLAGAVIGPARKLMSMLQGPAGALARALKAWTEKKEGDESSAGPPPPERPEGSGSQAEGAPGEQE